MCSLTEVFLSQCSEFHCRMVTVVRVVLPEGWKIAAIKIGFQPSPLHTDFSGLSGWYSETQLMKCPNPLQFYFAVSVFDMLSLYYFQIKYNLFHLVCVYILSSTWVETVCIYTFISQIVTDKCLVLPPTVSRLRKQHRTQPVIERHWVWSGIYRAQIITNTCDYFSIMIKTSSP